MRQSGRTRNRKHEDLDMFRQRIKKRAEKVNNASNPSNSRRI